MKFRDFMNMQEAMTSTSCIAGFSRITLPLVRRLWPSEVLDAIEEKDKKKKKEPYRVPQLKESSED